MVFFGWEADQNDDRLMQDGDDRREATRFMVVFELVPGTEATKAGLLLPWDFVLQTPGPVEPAAKAPEQVPGPKHVKKQGFLTENLF